MLYSIQYLRALAALLVAGTHGMPTFGGGLGVDIFFVISGFVMWQTTAKAVPPTPAEFCFKRVRRIVPLYWIVTIAMFVMPAISGTIAGSTSNDPMHLLTSLLFIASPYPADPKQWFPVYVPGWTINYEMFFYALFGLCLFIRDPRTRLWAIVGTLPLLVAAAAASGATGRVGWYASPIILEFAAGILIGAFYTQGGRIPLALALAALGAGLAVFLVAPNDPSPSRVFYWGIPAALVCFGALYLERLGHVPKLKSLKLLGDASYALYLTHLFSIGAVLVVWLKLGLSPEGAGTWLFAIVGLGASIVVGIAVHLIIERPLLKIGHRRARQTADAPS